jgi:hypothetical protein
MGHLNKKALGHPKTQNPSTKLQGNTKFQYSMTQTGLEF